MIDERKRMGFLDSVDIRFLEKTEKDRDISYPVHLIEFAEKLKKSNEKYFNIRLTTSLALPVYLAISSCAILRRGEPVLSVSSNRKIARLLSELINSIDCIAHIASERMQTLPGRIQ